jgi:hypothetical protein
LSNRRLCSYDINMKKILSSVIVLFALQSKSHLALLETAEILPDNYYVIGIAPQLRLSDGGGVDVAAFASMHAFQDTDARITIGGGETDFWTMASLKWVPFPDVDRQPAMGIKAGIGYVRFDDENITEFQIAPIVSKRADTRYGKMIPYISVPVTFQKCSCVKNNESATQLTIGSEWFPQEDRHIGAEFNLNLKNSTSSLAVYFSFPFEASTGYIRK